MSKARKKTFKKFGITDKKEIKKYRKYIRNFPANNRGFAFANLSAHLEKQFNLPILSTNPNEHE